MQDSLDFSICVDKYTSFDGLINAKAAHWLGVSISISIFLKHYIQFSWFYSSYPENYVGHPLRVLSVICGSVQNGLQFLIGSFLYSTGNIIIGVIFFLRVIARLANEINFFPFFTQCNLLQSLNCIRKRLYPGHLPSINNWTNTKDLKEW